VESASVVSLKSNTGAGREDDENRERMAIL